MIDNAVLVVNTRSRRGKELFGQSSRLLAEYGMVLAGSFSYADTTQLVSKVGELVACETPLVIVGGGDGTLSSVARHFVGNKSVLGVLPLGTGNEFARDLRIDCNIESACHTICKGRIAAVDVGVVGNTFFLNVVTVGMSTRIAEALTPDAKRRFGRFAYLVAVLRAVRTMKPFRVRIESTERAFEFEAVQIVIGNGRFHAGPFPLSPNASITDGELVVYGLKGVSRWSLLRYVLRLPGGRHTELETVPAMSVRAGSLETWPKKRYTVDGEVHRYTPISFSVRPAALSVIVGDGFGIIE